MGNFDEHPWRISASAITIDLSEVARTHHALRKRPEQELDLGAGQADGLASVLAAGSRGRHEAELVPWSEVLAHINTLFEGDGLSDGDQVSAVETVLRKMLENADLRAQALANNKVDFFSGPDLWHTIQEVIVEATDSQQRGLERLAADRSREEILAIMGMLKLWETLRQSA